MPPAGPRGGASTSTPPSRADAMAASTVCLGCVKPTASPVLRREHSGVPVGGSGPRESRARDRVLTSQPGTRDPDARWQTRHSPRRPLRRGASHDLTCRVSPPRTCRTLPRRTSRTDRAVSGLIADRAQARDRQITQGRMDCTEWPCGARAPSPSTASCQLVMKRPRMPPAGPRGVRRRDTRLDARFVAARATTSRVGSLPRTCRTLRLHLDDFTHGDCRAGARVSASRDEALALEPPDHEASEHEGSNALHGVAVWRPSTVAEHRELPAREEETANAPGRSEGRCEHLDLAVARRRDGRLDGLPRMREAHSQPRPTSRTLRCSGRRLRTEGVASTRPSRPRPHEPARYARPRRTMADATLASTPASSRREPRPHVSGLSPSDLPDTSSTNFTHGSGCVGAHRGPRAGEGPPDHAGSNGLHGVAVWRPSTVAEHRELPAREEETANAPGRSEGSAQTRHSPRRPLRRGASHDLTCRVSPPRTCRTLPRRTSRTDRAVSGLIADRAQARDRQITQGRMDCTEWPCGARTPSPSTASCQLVRRRPRRPPAGPRGGASTSTSPSRADAMAASAVCLGCVKPTASPVLRREHSGVPVGGSGSRESRALDPRDRVLTSQPGTRDPDARWQTRHSPRRPLRRGASHDLTCRVSPPRTCRTLPRRTSRTDRAVSGLIADRAQARDRQITQGRMDCTEWPRGARAPSPSTASCQLVRRRPRMPPAGPRGGASTSTPPSRADAMAASTVCLGCVKPTASPVLRREHSGVPVGGSGSRESRALDPRDRVLTSQPGTRDPDARWRTRHSPRLLHRGGASHDLRVGSLPRTCRTLRLHLDDFTHGSGCIRAHRGP
jgi:hypothetical protein